LDLPSDEELLLFGQYRLYEVKDNPEAELTIVIYSTGGRLGNNMFQYASSWAMVQDFVQQQHRKVLRFCLHPSFDMPLLEKVVVGPLIPKCDNLATMHEIPDMHYATYHPVQLPPCDAPACTFALKGYYQSWKYFDRYHNQILKQFAFQPDIIQEARSILTNTTGGIIKIGIHVRRGDMATRRKQGFYLRDPPVSYYEKAMKYFEDQYGSIQYIVASDDPEWCRRQSVFDKAVILTNHTAVVDMATLSLCHHVIVSRGTFSWWAAYLTKSKAIYYKDAFVLEHPENLGRVSLEDHFPPNWVGLTG
jgi:galactoside 2-L-fucosyltransferase 1/2